MKRICPTDSKPVVFDLDDLCDYWDPWDTLMRWRVCNPAGKVTLFAIPARCSDELIERYAALDWVELAIHGWWHQAGECLSWSSEETQERIRAATDRGLVNGFKAPGWLMTREVADGCAAMGTWIAGHVEHREIWQKGDRNYVYNRKRREDNWTAAHGHTHDTCGNGIDDAFDTFQFPADTQFKFVSEVVAHVD